MTAVIPSISREYLYVPVFATGSDAPNLTTLPVEMAFTDGTEPTAWTTAEWSDTATSPTARLLVGPSPGLPLAEGAYSVWVRVTGAEERPVRKAGRLKIT